jgi:hypothetical protein
MLYYDTGTPGYLASTAPAVDNAIPYYDTAGSGAITFSGTGINGNVMHISGGVPTWLANLGVGVDGILVGDNTSSSWLPATGAALNPNYLTYDGTNFAWSAINEIPSGTVTGDVLYWDHGAMTWTALAPGTSGDVLQTTGGGTPPVWTSLTGSLPGTTQGQLLYYDTGTPGYLASVAPGGDNSVPYYDSAGSGSVSYSGAGVNGNVFHISGGTPTWLANLGVGLAGVLIGDNTSSSWSMASGTALNPNYLTYNGTNFVWSAINEVPTGASTGDILYWDNGAMDWTILSPGTAGNTLQTNGSGAAPTWVVPGGLPGTLQGQILYYDTGTPGYLASVAPVNMGDMWYYDPTMGGGTWQILAGDTGNATVMYSGSTGAPAYTAAGTVEGDVLTTGPGPTFTPTWTALPPNNTTAGGTVILQDLTLQGLGTAATDLNVAGTLVGGIPARSGIEMDAAYTFNNAVANYGAAPTAVAAGPAAANIFYNYNQTLAPPPAAALAGAYKSITVANTGIYQFTLTKSYSRLMGSTSTAGVVKIVQDVAGLPVDVLTLQGSVTPTVSSAGDVQTVYFSGIVSVTGPATYALQCYTSAGAGTMPCPPLVGGTPGNPIGQWTIARIA